MDCPSCQKRLKTINSRKTSSGAVTWRRKFCPNCNLTFTSKEQLDLSPLIEVEGKPYSRSDLTVQISRLASKKSHSSVPDIVLTIESRLIKLSRHGHPITKQVFNSEVITVLSKLDGSAALRFKAESQES